MPSIELKSIDRIGPSDRLLIDADKLLTAGQKISEKTIRSFGKFRTIFVPTINFSYEEVERLDLYCDENQLEAYIIKEVQKLRTEIIDLRQRLFEKLKSVYIPFSESDSCFGVRGKKKQLGQDRLLEKEPGPLYQPDIDAGSEAIIRTHDLTFIADILKVVFTRIDKLTYTGPDTLNQKNTIKRITLQSIRLHSLYENTRLSSVGTAIPWHAVDCAFLFLLTMTNINKKRIVTGCPLSEDRFDPDKTRFQGSKYQYRPGMIMDAVFGILLHALGLCHQTIHKICSTKPVFTPTDPTAPVKRNLLQRNYYVIKNLLRNRRDVSSISKMMSAFQYDYADGTGYPPLNENKHLHEFVRLFQIIDFYDEMTNPVIFNVPYSRMDVIQYMQSHSGPYRHDFSRFSEQSRFDADLLNEFLSIIAPYYPGEKVYLFQESTRNTCIFVGRVFSYTDSWIPLISILRDARLNKEYRYGELLFNIPKSEAIHISNGKVVKKEKFDWIGRLEIFDAKINAGHLSEYEDSIFGKKRVLVNRLRGKRKS